MPRRQPPIGPTRDYTATTFVVREGKILLLWHNKIRAWLPPGGHIDLHELPEHAALREVREETGLDVVLVTTGPAAGPLGTVQVLHTPACILLEDIEPGHQHIDLIYFALAAADAVAAVNPREAERLRWYGWGDLADPEIAEDIRCLGRQALAAVAATRTA